MRILTAAMVAVTLLTFGSVAGLCQSARTLGMGWTGVAGTDDVSAWYWNPASLPNIDVAPKADGTAAWQAVAGTTIGGDAWWESDVFSLGAVSGERGFAAGRVKWTSSPTETEIGIGYGQAIGRKLSVGASVYFDEYGGHRTTSFGAGAEYKWDCRLFRSDKPAKLSLVALDVFDKSGDGTIFSAGMSAFVSPRLQLVVDCYDISDKVGNEWNFGGEYSVGKFLAGEGLKLRAGSHDGKISFGAGLDFRNGWSVDFAHAEFKEHGASTETKTSLVTVTKDF